MKLKTLISVSAMFVMPAIAQAESISVQVKGMVCAFCAQGIEKKFKARPEISKVSVSLETKIVSLAIKDGKEIPDEQIKKIVTEAGYGVVKVERVK